MPLKVSQNLSVGVDFKLLVPSLVNKNNAHDISCIRS